MGEISAYEGFCTAEECKKDGCTDLEQHKRKRRFGDRNDGRLLRTLDPMMKLMPYVMPARNDATNMFRGQADAENIDRYVQEKRRNGMPNFTQMHVILAAYVRLVSQRPGLNRFVSGQKIYARNNLEVMLCIKKEMKLNMPESVVSMIYPPDATADQVYAITEALIADAKKETVSFDKLLKTLDYIPGFVKRFVFWMIRVLDYFGWLPKQLKHLSPFHGSMFITSMASLGLPPIYHHIYNFGNVPVFIAFGVPEKKRTLKLDGTIESRKVLNYTMVMDERICDGHYYASAFRLFNGILRNPWQLDEAPKTIIEDVD